MSEIKKEVEAVIKTGREIVRDKQVDFPNKLNRQLDALKQLFNELGAQVRQTVSSSQMSRVSRLSSGTVLCA